MKIAWLLLAVCVLCVHGQRPLRDRGPRGFQGPPGTGGGGQGARGPQGVRGATGPDLGEQGAQGAAGAQGDAGNAGAQGATGVQGAAGAGGQAGVQGAVGATGGANVVTGSRGAQGLQGSPGQQGPAGNQGAQGGQGVLGVQGAQGPRGGRGPAGAQGPLGAQGVHGSTGPQGMAGAVAGRGAHGSAGAAGATGARGATGLAGAAPRVITEVLFYAQDNILNIGQFWDIPNHVTLLTIEAWAGGGSTPSGSPGTTPWQTCACAGAGAGSYSAATYNTSAIEQLLIYVGFGGTDGGDGEPSSVADVTPPYYGPAGDYVFLIAQSGLAGSCQNFTASGIVAPPSSGGGGTAEGSNLQAHSALGVEGAQGGYAWTSVQKQGAVIQHVMASGGSGGGVFGSMPTGGSPGILTVSNTTTSSGLARNALAVGALSGAGAAGCVATAGVHGIASHCAGGNGADGLVRIWY